MMRLKSQLVAGSATATLAIVLLAGPAAAQCVTTDNTVTCTGTTTSTQANAAINAAPPPSVTIRVADGATITNTGSNLQPLDPPFTGTVDFGNAGTLGTAAAPLGFFYFNPATVTGNVLAVTNSGTITGPVQSSNVAGATTVNNTGTIAGGLFLGGPGAITLSSSGSIYVAGGTAASTAINLNSQRLTTATTGVVGTDALTTTTVTGGLVTATLTGPVVIPAVGTTAAIPQDVRVFGIGGSTLTLDALAGDVFVGGSANASSFIPGGGNTSTADGTTTTRNLSTSTGVGGPSTAIIGVNGSAASLTVTSGPAAAAATVAGVVGSAAAPGNVFVSSTTQNTSFESTDTFTATGESFTSTNTSAPTGGAVSATVAGGGRVLGSVSTNSNGGNSTIVVNGDVGAGSGTAITTAGDVNSFTQGTSTRTVNTSSFASAAPFDFASSTTTTRTAGTGASAVTVGAGASVFGSVSSNADGGATVDNAGRIRNNVNLTSSRSLTTGASNSSSQVTTGAAETTLTQVNSSASQNTTQATGGSAGFTNRASGVIEDNVNVFARGNVTMVNAGAIFGNVSATSSGTDTTSANGSVNTTVTTAATGGGSTRQTTQVTQNSGSSTPTGGTVTGTYSGTVGATSESSLSGYRTVSQFGQAGSTATISGTLFADVTVQAGAQGSTNSSTTTITTTTQPAVGAATPAQEFTTVTSSRNASSLVAGDAVVTLTGAVRNNNSGTGDVQLFSSTGNAAFTGTNGTIDGGLTLSAATASATSSGSDFASRSTQAGTAAGPAAPVVAQSSTTTSFSDARRSGGSAAASLTGTRVNGAVSIFGRGTGAGSTGASLTTDAATTTGGISVSASGGADSRTESSTVDTRTGATAVTRTTRNTSVQTAPTVAGNAVANLGGVANGGVGVFGGFGNATANLTGRIAGGSGITVTANTTLNNSTSEATFSGTSATALTFPTQTGSASSSSTTNRGGTATLAIDTAAPLRAQNSSAVEGGIFVAGVGGSNLSIAAGSRVLGGNGAGITVGTGYTDTTSATTSTFTAGVLSGQNTTTTSTLVGGASTFSNAGTVGSAVGYFGAPVGVDVTAVGSATVTNSGTIFGTVDVLAGGQVTTSTTASTNIDDPVIARTVTTTTTTYPTASAATVNNSGVISGNVSTVARTGTLTNSGVLRGGVTLGTAIPAYTRTDTTTATSATTAVTLPATRPVQTYTVNQNGLLFGGVNVNDPTVSDPTTGAALTAPLRTSDIVANVNLNAGSITTGDVTAATAANMPTTRLTDTTLRLAGGATLGIGTTDTPSAAVGVGTAPLRFANTANYGAFVTTDPALGSLQGSTFVPNVGVGSGSRIAGVNLVEKAGAGTATIVGPSFQASTTAAPARYTADVGTFRISGGELQLGVAGVDPTTGAAIFGIRGNVENAGILTLGRTVTDGATTVLQGTNVRIDGNYTQTSAGSLGIAATPTLVRQAGTIVGAQPAQDLLGFGGYGVNLTPFVPFNPQTNAGLRSTPSSLTVNGNATLAGGVTIVTTPGAIYAAGRNQDLFTVNGTFTQTNATIASGFSSPFLRFVLTPRTVGTSTIVSLDVQRTAYSSVATNANAAAAATALDGTLPGVISRIQAIPNPNGVTGVQAYGLLQDLATVLSGIDTRLSGAQAAEAFDELGSGSYYGSLGAISTTAPFGEAVERIPLTTEGGVGLWISPNGSFARYSGDADTGAARLRADTYGLAGGFNISTGENGQVGIGGGYAHTDARTGRFGQQAEAETYMAGIYAGQSYGPLHYAVQLVFGWSNWDTTRTLPTFARAVTASFDSREYRLSARVGYNFEFDLATVTPFAKVEARKYDFETFSEQNGGGIGLLVQGRSRSVISPEVGVRVAGTVAGLQPFAEASYVALGDVESDRTVRYLGDLGTPFRLQGVDPDGYAKLGAGIQADLYGARFYLRGNYLTGGGVSSGEAQGGISLAF